MPDHAGVDVVIIGDGVIGLSTALELGRSGARCHLFGASHREAASGAAAGLLAPSIGGLTGSIRAFFDASLAMYPEFIADLQRFEPELHLIQGLIDVSSAPDAPGVRRLSTEELADLEPTFASAQGARFYSRDGAIDNQALVRALRRALQSVPAVSMSLSTRVESVQLSGAVPRVRTHDGTQVDGPRVVIAAGAWSPSIRGLPRPLPVEPLKGQMLAVALTGLRHPVMGDDIYLVPRRGEIAIGATIERAGFDVGVSPGAIETLRQSAIKICPSVRDAPVLRSWAGLRPATPDMLPLIGSDPADPRVLYATGHSKNGILLAPATAAAIAALAAGRASNLDLSPFRVDRF